MTQPQPSLWQQQKQKQAAFEKSKTGETIKLILAGIVALLVVGMFFLGDDDPKPAGENHETVARLMAQTKVKQQLKSPSTAEFELTSGQVANQGDGRYVVRDHVDSQNGFGATVRSEYVVELQYNGGPSDDPQNWTVTNVVIQ